MLLITDCQTVSAFWEALEPPDQRLPPNLTSWLRAEAEVIIAEAGAKGWVGALEANAVLIGAGLVAIGAANRETLKLLGAVPQAVYRRPRRVPHHILEREHVSAIDLANVLMRLKEAGLAVDPAPLCAALAPALKGREFLTEPELAVYWYGQERRPRAPLTIATRPIPVPSKPTANHLTADGYRAELFRDDAGAAIALRVTAPRRHQSKPRLSLVA